MKFYTREEIAQLLRVSDWQVGVWIRRGDLIETRLDRRVSRIEATDLAAFVKARRTA